MYQITWFNIRENKTDSLKVHSARSVQNVVDTLSRRPDRFSHIDVKHTAPRRIREYVITFEP